jgi:hypothetical protein
LEALRELRSLDFHLYLWHTREALDLVFEVAQLTLNNPQFTTVFEAVVSAKNAFYVDALTLPRVLRRAELVGESFGVSHCILV